MNWIAIIWSAAAGASVMLGLMHLLVWWRNHQAWANLFFVITVVGELGVAGAELGSMYAASSAAYAWAIQQGHLGYGISAVGCLGFIQLYFGTGKRWLLGLALGARLLALVANYTTGMCLHISAIDSLRTITFLGQQVSVLGEWTPNPWVRLGQVAALIQVVYVADASLRLWRVGSRESRRRALLMGGTLGFFPLFASAQAGLVVAGVLQTPIVVSGPFLAVLLVMAYEMSGDMLRAAKLGLQLQDRETKLTLVTEVVNIGLWVRDLVRDEIWANERWRTLFGFTVGEPLVFARFLERLHPEDRETVSQTLDRAVEQGGDYDLEFRVIHPADSRLIWIASHGRVEVNSRGKPVRTHGVSIEITRRKQEEQDTAQRRNELAHLSRVAMLGELSGSMAHELNQPLTAILSNAQAAERFLAHDTFDVVELREILADIVDQDNRAGEVIRRLRLLLKKGEVEQLPLDVNETVQEVLKLMRSDLVNQEVTAYTELAPTLPHIIGDRVQLQQVLLNLVMNACDAMQSRPPDQRRVDVCTEVTDGCGVRVLVSDVGVGIPPDKLAKIFEPFFTTKPHGLGLGLSVCRTIITAHGGTLEAANKPEGGACSSFTIPEHHRG